MSLKKEVKSPGIPTVLNKRQVAGYWNVSEKTIERWMAEGIHPKPFHMGGLTYWYRPAIDEFACQKYHAANFPEPGTMGSRDEPSPKSRKTGERRQEVKPPAAAENPFVPIEVLAPRRE